MENIQNIQKHSISGQFNVKYSNSEPTSANRSFVLKNLSIIPEEFNPNIDEQTLRVTRNIDTIEIGLQR